MRLKVLIVDDEPAAIKYLLTIFQEYSKDFEIADIAQDGEEALKKIEKSEPDIVITDIKMPLCNGLDLVSKAKINFPDIEYVLISGYKDFEYAQRAIREGVCDYVLKPIDVDSFVNLLNRLKEKIEKKYYDKQILLLKKIIADIKIDEKEIKKFLPWDKYFLCILREGGIPLKYSSKTKFINEINFETASEISPSKFENALYWQFFGRDDQELILITPDTGNKLTVVELFKKIFESKKDGGLYFTSVIVDYSFELFQLKDMLMKTLRFLDLNIVLGYTQIIHYNPNNSSSTLLSKESDINQREIEKKFSYYISNLMVESLEKELERVLDKLKEQKVPLIIVSSLFRNVIIFAAEQLNSEMKRYDIEYILDELISTSKRGGIMRAQKIKRSIAEVIALALVLIIYGIPFFFIFINSVKSKGEAASLDLSFPKQVLLIENYKSVLAEQDGVVVRAFINSTLITVFSVIVLVFVASMTGFIIQRRKNRTMTFISFLILIGLILPPSVVPTIWILKLLGLFKTLPGIVLIEVALGLPFATLLYSNFLSTIPQEIDESALIDGCNSYQLFFRIIFPLLKPVTATIVILSSISIYNDFVNPLYFLPGAENPTVQLTLYNFMSRYNTSWNLLFADVVLISIPPLILFIFFNRKIISGMVAGAIKA
ncbi:response regulator [Caldicellulosiruptor sp. DIB 104C]|uniref:response regulator n=1 Tax=Caldicellulosiruptor sp. DIB 104C TaxID=3019889 RepID=UPI002305295C|nr:response regulator [Caldicellulosiruptor sp. DIB 104C]